MSEPITIVGGGFAALQLVKSLRRRDAAVPIRLLAADDGGEYNKPELSHALSRGTAAAAMTTLSAQDFARQHAIELLADCRVEALDLAARRLGTSRGEFAYERLVLATGARALKPSIPGAEHLLTLNSLREYASGEAALARAQRVMVLGAGLIGSELAMDFARAGREVALVDLAHSPLAALMPAMLAQPLLDSLRGLGIVTHLGTEISRIDKEGEGYRIELANGLVSRQDLVLAAIGLAPEIDLARQAGLQTERGITVDHQLRSSDPFVYALGDCAEFEGRVRPFLQPALLGANALAATLLGQPTALQLPPMLVTVKTPLYPLQLAGRTQGEGIAWRLEFSSAGLLAHAYDEAGRFCGFVAGGDRQPQSFALLRELMQPAPAGGLQ